MAPPAQQDKEKKKNIEDQPWYHGFRPRKDAVRLINQPGQWLVRATDNGPTTDIVITACDEKGKTVNITMRFDNNHWYLAQKGDSSSNPPSKPIKNKFPTIVDLVDYYRAHHLSKNLRLTQMVPKPQWMVKHENVVYEEKDKLGAGNFCSVYKGTLKKQGETEAKIIAVKISLVAAAATDAESDEAKEARKAMMHEAEIMSYYTHENVIQFLGVACDHQPVLVLMEFCPGGDLLSHLTKHGKKTDDREKLLYLYEAGRGMMYLHNKKCVHRDLAARNCLISANGKVKIADFGLSKVLDSTGSGEAEPEDAAKSSNAQVPVRWMAPETLRKQPAFSNASDVWAFGVMTYEVFSNGVKPWPDDPVKFVATAIRKGNMPKMPEGTPHKVCNLVTLMWADKPDKRPNMRHVAREFNVLIKDACEGKGHIVPAAMTLNKITGVSRGIFFEHEETSEFEDTSGTSSDNAPPEPVDKSCDDGRKRIKASTRNQVRKTSSLREKKASQDK